MIRSKNSTELAARICKRHSDILKMIRSPHHSHQTMQNITLSIALIPKALTSSILQKKIILIRLIYLSVMYKCSGFEIMQNGFWEHTQIALKAKIFGNGPCD